MARRALQDATDMIGLRTAEAHAAGAYWRAWERIPVEQLATLPQPCSFWQTALSADARRLVCAVSGTERDVWLAENFDPEG